MARLPGSQPQRRGHAGTVEALRSPIETDFRPARLPIQPFIAQHHEVLAYRGGQQGTPAAPMHPTHFEDVPVIGREQQFDDQIHGLFAVIDEAQVLVAGLFPQHHGAEDMDAALGDEQMTPAVEIGRGHVHHQQAVVLLDRGTEQDRALPIDPQFPVGQEARALMIKAVLGQFALSIRPGLKDVPMAVEHPEGVALLEHPGRLLGFRRSRCNVPLIFDRRIRLHELSLPAKFAAKFKRAEGCLSPAPVFDNRVDRVGVSR